MTFSAALVAHEGGWDEILLVGGPIVVIIGLLALAKRRVDRLQADQLDDGRIEGGRIDHDRTELDRGGEGPGEHIGSDHGPVGDDRVERRRHD